MTKRLWNWPALALATAAVGCAAAPPREPPVAARSGPLPVPALREVPLVNGSFESPARADERCAERWNCVMHGDPSAYVFTLQRMQGAEGGQALCIRRVKNEPWALANQMLLAEPMRGRRVRVSIAVRAEAAEGASIGPWVLVRGPNPRRLAHEERLVTRTPGWERISVEVPVEAGAETIELGATMQGGGGACVDDVRLEVLP